MERIALHLEVRNALSLADELGRHEHALGNDELAGHLAALRSSLSELERRIGRSYAEDASPKPSVVEAIQNSVTTLRERREEIPRPYRLRFGRLVAAADRVVFGVLRPAAPVPSMPVLGLPTRRLVPQDVHSVMDYLAAGAFALSAKLATTSRGRAVGAILAGKIAGVSALTDYRLSLVKAIPVEVHEVLDHATGITGAAAPLVLGYAKKDPIAATIQIATGVAMVVASLFTDYRATKGLSWPVRSKGGPSKRDLDIAGGQVAVARGARPLEGLASAPSDWQPDVVGLVRDEA